MMHSSRRIRVALLFGGKSTEHEVSLNSALSILDHIDRDKYDVLPVKIGKNGNWGMLPSLDALNSYEVLSAASGKPVLVGGADAKALIHLDTGDSKDLNKKVRVPLDVVFPVLHGTFGEDGSVQGLLRMADLPCVGAGVLASALGMDKIMMKQVFFQNDLAAVDFMWFLRRDWEKSPEVIRKAVADEIGFPCFVKPANTGSSVGVEKAHDNAELDACIDRASAFDRKILVEKAVNARELECSVLGNDDPEASLVGEIIPCHEYYDYDAKYVDAGSEVIIPADLPEETARHIRSMAVAAFKALDCAGMARVDFFLERDTGHVYINELNTIPGFTPISMYPQLWEASGVAYRDLIDRLIRLAIERHEDLNRSRFQRG